jgi:site-specific DNA recombinase
MTSVAIYARVSSARQKKDQTIGSQTAALRAHAAEKRLELPEEWVFEDEGHSGATLVRPALERLRDLVAQVGVDVVLCYTPDRLARKFAYQALLIEEFARAGTRVEFVRGPRGDSPEDQLMVQFQGMFAEYEKAQLMERYRRGKTYRARSGSVNVLGGAPFGYRYLRKTPECGATYEIVESEAVLVVELFRRYTDDGASIADLTRWLTSSNIPTRTGKTRWDRSVVWGMLRNPAYKGQAAFGKTQTLHESPGLNRRARLEGRSTPRAVKAADRPHEEWITIPVPALITPATFERAAQRLADNKRFASRNSKIPSLLQGLSACVSCGYGYYRTSTTTSSGKKIYYYRCLGSDDYRYEGGRVCANKPVRADYLDTVVWDHIIGMIADPHLIRTEIDKRLERARTSDPATRQRGRLELALAKATTAITRMIEAFQEQLVTLDELRSRMPDLRARESNLRGQLAALDASIADRDAYLKLADDLKGFLAQLRDNAESAEVPERQRVLRLLVKDVLIGPEKITIRHRIPVRERATDDGQLQDQDATEGDSRPSCPLRWGRQGRSLRCPFLRSHDHPVSQDSGFQVFPDQLQDLLVLHPTGHSRHERVVVHAVKELVQVEVHSPAVSILNSPTANSHGLMGRASWTETERRPGEMGVEYGHQGLRDRLLDEPVQHTWNSKHPFPAVRLRDGHPTNRSGLISSRVEFGPYRGPVPGDPRPQFLRGHPIDSGGSPVDLDAPERREQILLGEHHVPQGRLAVILGPVARRPVAALPSLGDRMHRRIRLGICRGSFAAVKATRSSRHPFLRSTKRSVLPESLPTCCLPVSVLRPLLTSVRQTRGITATGRHDLRHLTVTGDTRTDLPE